jgi:hypothetical protein
MVPDGDRFAESVRKNRKIVFRDVMNLDPVIAKEE